MNPKQSIKKNEIMESNFAHAAAIEVVNIEYIRRVCVFSLSVSKVKYLNIFLFYFVNMQLIICCSDF